MSRGITDALSLKIAERVAEDFGDAGAAAVLVIIVRDDGKVCAGAAADHTSEAGQASIAGIFGAVKVYVSGARAAGQFLVDGLMPKVDDTAPAVDKEGD